MIFSENRFALFPDHALAFAGLREESQGRGDECVLRSARNERGLSTLICLAARIINGDASWHKRDMPTVSEGCPVMRVDRKRSAHPQNDANDPQRPQWAYLAPLGFDLKH